MGYNYSTHILHVLMIFLSISALVGSFGLLTDVSGAGMGFTIEMLEGSPFSNFFVPGLFLLSVLGVFPIFVVYSSRKQQKCGLLKWTNPHKRCHWSWFLSYCVGLILILWLIVEVLIIKDIVVLHYIYSIVGLLIIIFTLLPSTRLNYTFK